MHVSSARAASVTHSIRLLTKTTTTKTMTTATWVYTSTCLYVPAKESDTFIDTTFGGSVSPKFDHALPAARKASPANVPTFLSCPLACSARPYSHDFAITTRRHKTEQQPE
ncbi:unnamed protein product [Ectocarpus sp. 12 AP-2014]